MAGWKFFAETKSVWYWKFQLKPKSAAWSWKFFPETKNWMVLEILGRKKTSWYWKFLAGTKSVSYWKFLAEKVALFLFYSINN